MLVNFNAGTNLARKPPKRVCAAPSLVHSTSQFHCPTLDILCCLSPLRFRDLSPGKSKIGKWKLSCIALVPFANGNYIQSKIKASIVL